MLLELGDAVGEAEGDPDPDTVGLGLGLGLGTGVGLGLGATTLSEAATLVTEAALAEAADE